MNIECLDPSVDLGWCIRAVPLALDAHPPMDRLIFERAPRVLTPDRLAVAASIVFGEYCSEEINFKDSVTTQTGAAIRRFVNGRIAVVPIDAEPRRLPIGATILRLVGDGDVAPESSRSIFGMREISFRPSRIDLAAGVRSGLHSFEIGSNGWLLGAIAPVPCPSAIEIASAVLFAEELEADRIIVPSRLHPGDAIAATLTDLLESVRLGLQFESFDDCVPSQ